MLVEVGTIEIDILLINFSELRWILRAEIGLFQILWNIVQKRARPNVPYHYIKFQHVIVRNTMYF